MTARIPRGCMHARGAVVALLALIATGGWNIQAHAATRELRVGVSRLPATLDPAQAVTTAELMVLRLLSSGLVAVGERGEIVPALASQWAVSRDGLSWTFRLRDDVRFTNGAPLTAADAVASLASRVSADEPREPALRWARVFQGAARVVREVSVGEIGTVRIQLSEPYAPLLALLAHPALAITVPGKTGESAIVGTGPYRPVEQAPGRLVLEAVSEGPSKGSVPPKSDRLVLVEVNDDPAGLAGLGPGGSLDVYLAQSPPTWAALGLQVLSGPAWQVGLLALRSDQGPLRQRAFRQAVSLALDPALIAPALGRWATPVGGYLPPGAWGGREAPRTYDLTRAKRLLGQLGVTDPALTLLAPETPSGPDLLRLAEAIRAALAAAGVRIRVRAEAPDSAVAAMRRGEADLALFEASLEVDDPDAYLHALLASEVTTPGSATNVAFFRSPLVDGMLSRASQLGFRPERLRLYQRLQTFLAEEVPYVPLYARLHWLVARPEVRGVGLEPSGLHRLGEMWIEAPTELPATAPAPASPAPAVPAPPPPPVTP